jgi:signal peptidase I
VPDIPTGSDSVTEPDAAAQRDAGPTQRPAATQPRQWSRETAHGDGGAGRDRGRGDAKRGGFFSELPVLVLIAFVLALLMKTFLVQAFYIPSSSMEPTLLVNDRVLVNKLSHTFREPRRGEIVVFSEAGFAPTGDEEVGLLHRVVRSVGTGLGLVPPSEKDFIKRIIGLPGETVEMRGGVVHIDGQPIPEAPTTEGGYLSSRDLTEFGPVTVPQGEYFMMGDNRPSSADSRTSLGTIPADHIIGRAFVVIWPFDRFKGLGIVDYGMPAEDEVSQAWLPLAS